MATLDSDDIQEIARLRRPSNNICFVRSSGGSDSNDGKSWSSAWATVNKAATTAISGDTVFLGPGIFANGSTQINPSLGVWWFGAGIDVTVLTFSGTVSTGQPRCVLKGNSRWQDLTLSCTDASNSATAGASIAQDNDISNLVLNRIKIVSALDCITFNSLSTFFRNVRIEHCFLFSTWDGLQLAASQTSPGGEIQIRDSTIVCVTTDANKFGKCIICQTSNTSYIITCVNSIFISDTTGGSAQSRAISIDGAHQLDFVGGSVRSAGNTPLDFSLANDPIIRVSNTFIFDTNKVSGGDIQYAPLQCM